MEKISRSKRYNLISLVTFLVIVITFGYYYFFYVNSRENHFNEKAFRVIENISKNVEKKYKNYFTNVYNAINHMNEYDNKNYYTNEGELRKGFDNYDVPKEITIVRICSKRLNTHLTVEDFQSQLAEDEMGMIIKLNSDTTLFCKYKTSHLFKNTLKKDFFKSFVVISVKRESEGVSDLSYHMKLLHSDIPLVFNYRKGQNVLDTALFGAKALSSTRLAHIDFEGNVHNLYISPVDIGNGTTLYIGGIVENDVFRETSFALSPFTFSIIIVVLLFLILLLPFLKLYLISENERLNTIDAVFSFVSIVVGSAFVFVIMLNWQSRNENSLIRQRGVLHNYANNIENELKAEIKESLKLLNDFDTLHKDTSICNEQKLISEASDLFVFNYGGNETDTLSYKVYGHKGKGNSINEFKYARSMNNKIPFIKIKKNRKNNWNTEISFAYSSILTSFNYSFIQNEKKHCPGFTYDIQDTSFIDTKKYPRINQDVKTALFWTNKKGDQLVKWSTRSNTPRVNVGKRPYFKQVINGNLWTDTRLNDDPFFMYAILSWTDGNTYMMFSKKSHDTSKYTKLPVEFKKEILGKSKDTNMLKPKVVVLAKKLTSMKDLPIPSNISYMLVDENGEVMYHQDESKILQENLLNEIGFGKELKGALQTHNDTFFSADYDGKKRSFYMKPVGKLPIFLITSLNAEHERITDIQTLAMSNLLYLLLILLLAAQIGVFVLVNRKPKIKTAGRNLLFCWFWPDKRKHLIYKTLSVYLILAIIIYFSFAINRDIFISLSFFSLLATFVIFILKWHHDTCESNYVRRNFIYLFLVLAFNGVLFYNSFNNGWRVWNFGYVVFGGLSLAFYARIKNKFTNAKYYEEKSVIQSYSVFVFLLVLSLGLFPLIGFYSKSYNLEKELNTRSMQVDLAEKLASVPKKKISGQLLLTQRLNKPVINVYTIITDKTDLENKNCDSVGQACILSPPELKFVKNLRFTYDTNMYNSASIDFLQYDPNRYYNWGSEDENSILYDQHLNLKFKSGPERFHIFHSGHSFNYLIFLVLGFIIYCFVFFYSIKYWATRIFLLGLPHKKKKDELELILKSFKFIYLISLPHSGVKRFLSTKFKKSYVIPIRECVNEVFVKEQLDEIKGKHFENIILYDSDSFTEQLIKTKTNLIIGLLKFMGIENHSLKKLILVSNTHPSYKVKRIKRKDDNDTTVLDQYLNVLGNFKRVFFPFGFLPQKTEKSADAAHLITNTIVKTPIPGRNGKMDFPLIRTVRLPY